MSLDIFKDLEQGSSEWLAARCGIVTASVIGQVVSSRQPTAIEAECPDCGAQASDPCTGKRSPGPLKTLHPARAAAAREMSRVIAADNYSETSRALIATLAAERITNHVEPIHASRDMERGTLDEPYAREIYSEHYATVDEIGFIVREDDGWGFKLGYSPDGLVGDDGLIEIKSRNQKKHLQTILANEVPAENMAQCQAGLFISGREWIDYVSYCGGMRLWTKRVEPDDKWQAAIIDAAKGVEETAAQMIASYKAAVEGRPDTERIDHFAPLELIF